MAQFESGRRLCLLFEAGGARYAVEATAVTEVANPDVDSETLRGSLELKDLSKLMGGGQEQRPGMAVVLDVSPTLAVRIAKIVEVADVARDPFFLLPPSMGEHLPLILRGAIQHGDRLFLELITDAIPHSPVLTISSVARPIYPLEELPERALVFESKGRLYGIPLNLVSQVVPGTDAFCALPAPGGPVAGLFPHGQVLWPIYSVSGLLGAPSDREELFILTELAGQNVGLCASRILGVQDGFTPGQPKGEFTSKRLGQSALFLDFQRMFS